MNATDLLPAVFAGALVVICGGLYALALAFARLYDSKLLGWLSQVAYAVLVICAFVLADSLALSTMWYALIVIMLAGYWYAPRAIWHLTVATHAPEAR